MLKRLQILIALLFAVFSIQAQIIYENFEGGSSKIAWNVNNGLKYEGPVANPLKNAVDSSDFVGKFINDGISDFCFGLGDLTGPADLSKFNVMKIKIWAPVAPTSALLKFEGGGKNVEKFIDIKVANEWVEYAVDFSGGASFTMLNKVLLAFHPFTTPQAGTYYFDDIVAYNGKAVFETFETGNEMNWMALDGSLVAPIANPDSNSVNGSAKCGKYTKSGTHSYSLLLAERSMPFDLSVLNQMKIQLYTDAATQVLLKLEGPGGPPVEKIVNIGVRNAWQEYTFDMSAGKDFKHLTKAILFFDPGVEASMDDYYFDNFYAVAKGACANSTPNPDIIDDFECNRNATYVNGWDSLSVVPNPSPNAVNNSSMVGKYVDPLMEQWAALLIDYQNPLVLSTKNQLKVKIFTKKVTRVLFKLEGGVSPAIEKWIDLNEVNQWVEYTVDFSSEALASHKKIVMFFNAGNDPVAGDTYYIDDISWGVKTNVDLENFEAGASLPWEPLDQQTVIHGVFAVIANPNSTGINTSSKVGKYTKGASPFSTLAAVAPGAINTTLKPQFNMDVLAPLGSKTVTIQLESATAGNKEVVRDITNAGNWETLSFDFANFKNITDWAAIKLIFNQGVAENGAMYFFDNIRQGESTVDPCEGAVKLPNIIDDFECQRNYAFGAGAQLVTVVNNPKLSATNSSVKVGLYKDQPNEPWAALCTDFPEAINLDVFNQLEFQVLSTKVVPVLLKLEGGTSPQKEIWTDIKTANDWYSISADFSGEKGKNHKRVCIFFNGGVETTTVDDYFIDNIKFSHAPYDGCVMNFDDPAFVSNKWSFFPADNSGGFELVDNPLKAGLNISNKVGKAIEKASGEQPWQGMYANLDSYIKFGANKLIRMKVLSPKVGTITMKVEGPLVDGFPGSGDLTISNTKAGVWEDLVWDFSASPTPINPAGKYARITLIFDINNLPAQDVVYYFDDVRLDGADCGQVSSSNDIGSIEKMSISPNPVYDVLQIHKSENIKFTDIVNINGQRIARVWNNNQATQYIDVSNIQNGAYIVLGYNTDQKLIAQSRFIKM